MSVVIFSSIPCTDLYNCLLCREFLSGDAFTHPSPTTCVLWLDALCHKALCAGALVLSVAVLGEWCLWEAHPSERIDVGPG